jgi:hypothetical protein
MSVGVAGLTVIVQKLSSLAITCRTQVTAAISASARWLRAPSTGTCT